MEARRSEINYADSLFTFVLRSLGGNGEDAGDDCEDEEGGRHHLSDNPEER